MASVQYGAMVPNLAGKVGGQNFQRGLAAPILRNISTKRKFIQYPQIAPNLINHRAAFGYVAQSWKNITAGQRSDWKTATTSFPRTNKFGGSYIPSAYQLFCEFNMALVIAGLSLIAAAPTTSTFVSPVWEVVYDSGAGIVTVNQSVVYTASPYQTVISASYYQSNGLGLRKSNLKDITVHQFSIGSPSLNITSLITSLFGSIMSGVTMYVAIKQININTGELSMPQYFPVAF